MSGQARSILSTLSAFARRSSSGVRIKSAPLAVVLAALLMGLAVQPALAVEAGETGSAGAIARPSTIGALNPSQELPARKEIKLRFATFDPLAEGPPRIPDPLGAPADSDVYLVQLTSQPREEQKDQIRELGARISFYVPDHAYIVRMRAEVREAVEALDFVRWVGPYHPAYKLEEELVKRLTEPPVPEVAQGPAQRYSIMVLERGADAQGIVADAVRRVGGRVRLTTAQGFRLEASLDDAQLLAIARLGEILFIDRWAAPGNDMDIVREISGADFLESVAGYTGQDVRGEVMDSRLRTTHEAFQATPPVIHAGNTTPTEACGGDGHGTCAYGIVFGDGAGDATARGLLPDGQGIFASRFSVANRYTHTAELVDPADDFRAVFQTNSWGGGLTTDYTTVSAEMDDILFLNDILVTQSQSNAGNQNSRPQAWAKNIVSVGGIRHQNTLDRSDDAWNNGASIGGADDGRIKPDLSHFYDSVWTTSSTGNAAYENFSGTSAATPITAGHFGLMFQMWADGVFSGAPGAGGDVFDSRPHMTTAKALMINTAFQYDFIGTTDDLTRVHQGWGMVDVENLYELARQHAWQLPLLIDEDDVIGPGETNTYSMDVGANDCFLKATMTYADPMGNPAATQDRINDLSLRLVSPTGTTFWGNNGLLAGTVSTPGGTSNTLDTVENVIIESAEVGTWTIEILGDEIVEDAHTETAATDADYALVVTKCSEADLALAKSDNPDPVIAGEQLVYDITVVNNGPDVALDVVVTDTLPTEVTYVSDSGGCDTSTLPTLVCDLGDMTAGTGQTFSITVRVKSDVVFNAGGPTTITNTASVDALANDPTPGNDSTTQQTAVVAAADLAILSFDAVSPPTQVVIGDSVSVSVQKTITNHGPSAPMDARLTMTATASPGATVVPASATLSEPALGLNEQRTIAETFTISCQQPGPHGFTFGNEIQPTHPADTDPNRANNTAEESFTVECTLPPLDHFKCYDVEGKAFKPRHVVTLTDQFHTERVAVGKPDDFCNPVDKNAEGISDPTAHLTCYSIQDVKKDKSRRFSSRAIEVENQFGKQTLKLKKPRTLCAPSSKSLLGDPGPPPRLLDHFKCYQAQGERLSPRPEVVLTDQFGTQEAIVDKPALFCTPADKNDEGILRPDQHLVCYEIKPRESMNRSVSIRNQFGTATLRVKKAETLCVPSLQGERLPDLTVAIPRQRIPVTCSGTPVTCTTTVEFTVSNIGAAPVPAGSTFLVLLESDPGLSVSKTVAITVPAGGLPPAASLPLQTELMPSSGNCYDTDCTVRATVDSANQITEANEGNNVDTYTHPG